MKTFHPCRAAAFYIFPFERRLEAMRRYLRGEIYYANLDPVFGSEQSGFRPVLIIQNDIGNRYSPTVIVAPITSKPDVKAKLPTHCRLDLKIA